MPAVLESRIPQIIAELGPRIDLVAREGADLIAARAKSRAPVETGRLRDSIHVEDEGNDHYVVADAEDAYGTPYAIYVEFGGHGGGGASGPHAFLLPALEETKETIIAAANLAVDKL